MPARHEPDLVRTGIEDRREARHRELAAADAAHRGIERADELGEVEPLAAAPHADVARADRRRGDHRRRDAVAGDVADRDQRAPVAERIDAPEVAGASRRRPPRADDGDVADARAAPCRATARPAPSPRARPHGQRGALGGRAREPRVQYGLGEPLGDALEEPDLRGRAGGARRRGMTTSPSSSSALAHRHERRAHRGSRTAARASSRRSARHRVELVGEHRGALLGEPAREQRIGRELVGERAAGRRPVVPSPSPPPSEQDLRSRTPMPSSTMSIASWAISGGDVIVRARATSWASRRSSGPSPARAPRLTRPIVATETRAPRRSTARRTSVVSHHGSSPPSSDSVSHASSVPAAKYATSSGAVVSIARTRRMSSTTSARTTSRLPMPESSQPSGNTPMPYASVTSVNPGVRDEVRQQRGAQLPALDRWRVAQRRPAERDEPRRGDQHGMDHAEPRPAAGLRIPEPGERLHAVDHRVRRRRDRDPHRGSME